MSKPLLLYLDYLDELGLDRYLTGFSEILLIAFYKDFSSLLSFSFE